nr:LysR substrate-binding domain-containing protein [Nevskia soli]
MHIDVLQLGELLRSEGFGGAEGHVVGVIAAARLSLGLIQAPRYHLAADLAAGTLVAVLPQWPPSATPVSLLYPHRRQLSPRVRVFIDWIAREFARHEVGVV